MVESDLAVGDDAVRAFKTRYWTTPGVGSEYHYLAYSSDPITRMKNLTELGFVLRAIEGNRVLDAGAGTGRFTIPLRKAGLHVFAVDYSREMLRTGIRAATKQIVKMPAAVGDVFQLPFPDASLDSVVSITVIRHFPQWESILAEYARVIRDDGAVIVEIASGDQAAYLSTYGMASDAPGPVTPMGFNAPVTLDSIADTAQRVGLHIARILPYDVLNDNALLRAIHRGRYENVVNEARKLLQHDGGIAAYDFIARTIFATVGPAALPSVLLVLRKSVPETAWEIPSAPVDPGVSTLGLDQLVAAAAYALGDQGAAIRERYEALNANPTAHDFLDFLDQSLVRAVSPQIWTWRAPKHG